MILLTTKEADSIVRLLREQRSTLLTTLSTMKDFKKEIFKKINELDSIAESKEDKELVEKYTIKGTTLYNEEVQKILKKQKDIDNALLLLMKEEEEI